MSNQPENPLIHKLNRLASIRPNAIALRVCNWYTIAGYDYFAPNRRSPAEDGQLAFILIELANRNGWLVSLDDELVEADLMKSCTLYDDGEGVIAHATRETMADALVDALAIAFQVQDDEAPEVAARAIADVELGTV